MSIARDVKQLWETGEPLGQVVARLAGHVNAMEGERKARRNDVAAQTARPAGAWSAALSRPLRQGGHEQLRQMGKEERQQLLRDLRDYASRPIGEQDADAEG